MLTPRQMERIRRGNSIALFDRSANERMILSIIQNIGPLPSVEIARRTQLSAQSASVITRSLEADGLLLKGDPVRGKVGKPLTPFLLNKDGAFSLGLRIGRRSADMVLLDFVGGVRGHIASSFAYPTPQRITDIAQTGMTELMSKLPPDQQARIAGFGVAAPFELWKWLDATAIPKADMMAWRDFDFAEAFSAFTALPVVTGNDGSLACMGEHAFGSATGFSDFVYFYVGSFIGGGVVTNNHLHLGARGNAGAFGSLPVRGPDGQWRQLISHASVVQLEAKLDGRWPGTAQDLLKQPDWAGFDDLLEDWMADTSEHLGYAAITAAAAFDVPHVVVDCGAPQAVKRDLISRMNRVVAQADCRGIERPVLVEGRLGPMAGALGAAYQPIVGRLLRK